jgi:hypothetical protein
MSAPTSGGSAHNRPPYRHQLISLIAFVDVFHLFASSIQVAMLSGGGKAKLMAVFLMFFTFPTFHRAR